MRILFFRIIQIHDHFPIGLIHHVLIPLTGTFRHILPPLQSAYLHLLTDLFSPLNNLPLKLPTALLNMSLKPSPQNSHLCLLVWGLSLQHCQQSAVAKSLVVLDAAVRLDVLHYEHVEVLVF